MQITSEKIRILVVDDNETILLIVEKTLKRHGFIVYTANKGRDGLKLLMQHKFDIMVVDLKFEKGGMQGQEFLTEALNFWPWLGVVVISGYLDGDLTRSLQKMGITRMLHKPFEFRKLREAISEEYQEKKQNSGLQTTGLSLDRYQQQLQIFGELIRNVLECDSLTEAMTRLSYGINSAMPSSMIGILSLEETGAHLSISHTAIVEENVIADFKENILNHFIAITGMDDIESKLETVIKKSNLSCSLVDSEPRTILVPFMTNKEVGGILALYTRESDLFVNADTAFLYNIPTHLSTIFTALNRMQNLAVKDGLTGLYNRVYTDESIQHMIEHAHRNKTSLSVAIFDLDHFKKVNDEYGHLVGDSVLKGFAETLLKVSRKSDVIGRYGGEEFLALLPNTDVHSAEIFIQRIFQEMVITPYGNDNVNLDLTVSVGVTGFCSELLEEEDPAEMLLKRADEALYAAKEAGRNRWVVWEDDCLKEAVNTVSVPEINQSDPLFGKNIIVVDDEGSILSVLKKILDSEGYFVTTCDTAEKAIKEICQNHIYDLVITDLCMPDRSGIDLIKELATIDRTIVKIVMTGYASLESAVESMRHGAFDYIQKPFSTVQLLPVIERALKYRKVTMENKHYQLYLEQMVQEKNARLKDTLEEVKKSYQFSLEAMVKMLDAREQDTDTGCHSVRVKEMTLVMGRMYGMDDNDLEILGRGALLHDIGKISIPDAVLLKPGKLTDIEYKIIKKHVRFGYEILKEAKWLEESAEIVYSHHENWDGSGYPRRLKGKDICIGARIFAIVDTYDAMRSDRIYRDSIPEEDTIKEIQRCKGTQFDPELVNLFVECQPLLERCFQQMKNDE